MYKDQSTRRFTRLRIYHGSDLDSQWHLWRSYFSSERLTRKAVLYYRMSIHHLTHYYRMFDVKVLLLSSLFVFEVGSALCGAAPSSAALIVGRVIAGAGGAGMYMGALTYISVFSTTAEAMLYNALTGLMWGVGTIVGPVIGGAFSDSSATWRWVRRPITWIKNTADLCRPSTLISHSAECLPQYTSWSSLDVTRDRI